MRRWISSILVAALSSACTPTPPPSQPQIAEPKSDTSWSRELSFDDLRASGASVPEDSNLFDLWQGPDDEIIAVGAGPMIVASKGNGWEVADLPAELPALRALHGNSQGAVTAVGDTGAIVSRVGDAWRQEAKGLVETDLRAVFVTEAGTVWATGDAGVVIRGEQGTWVVEDTASTDRFNGLWKSTESLWAVGNFGVALRRTEEGWQRTRTDIGRNLSAIWGPSEDAIFAVGLEGTLLRWDGEQWTSIPHLHRPYLRAIWGRSAEDVYVAGWGGAVLHFDGKRVCDISLHDWRLEGISGDASSVRVAGVHGEIWSAALTGEDCPPEVDGPPVASWEVETVADRGAGRFVNVDINQAGNPVVAFFRPIEEEVECGLGSVDVKTGQSDVVFAERSSSGWVEEQVATVSVVFGLSMAVDASDTPHVAYMGGNVARQWCGASDMVISSRGGASWGERTVLQDSNTGQACHKGQNVCNLGDVTGLWPSLAFSAERSALAFQDIHFGFTKEDWESSDQELALGPGSWQSQSVEDSTGAGQFSDVVFDSMGRVAVVWFNQKEGGLWFSREGDEGFTEAIQIAHGDTAYPLSMRAMPEGGYGVAYYSKRYQGLFYAHSEDGESWEVTAVDETAHTGLSPSLAIDPNGQPVIAYSRCNEVLEDICDPARDGVWVARKHEAGWQRQLIPQSSVGEARDGEYVALAIDPNDGTLWVAFQRSRFDEATESAIIDLRIARGAPE